ncbi:MAG TPA: hypothetical protein VJ255_15825 [Candidatus Acidoferrum sp.]|nr:hypothetical protein [Candidatus Acidoferrum sp.]
MRTAVKLLKVFGAFATFLVPTSSFAQYIRTDLVSNTGTVPPNLVLFTGPSYEVLMRLLLVLSVSLSARAGFSCYINTLAAQMTQNPDAYDSGRLELFNRSYTGQISGDHYFGLVNSIRDGSMSAFGTFPSVLERRPT